MKDLVDFVLRLLVTKRKDLFGDGTFVEFKLDNDEQFIWTDGFNSNALFGQVVYQRNGESYRSPPLVLKLSPKKTFFPELAGLGFANEILFYTDIVPWFESARGIDSLFPKFYNSLLHSNPGPREAVIVFENLQASGYVTAMNKSFLDIDHLKLMMRKLGEFHAYSYQMKKFDPKRFHGLAKSFHESIFITMESVPSTFITVMTRGLQNLLDDPLYSDRLANVQEMVKVADDVFVEILTSDMGNPISVVCHGDFLRNNVLFKYEDGVPVDLKIVDLAACRLASPVVDLATVLYVNADQKTRDEHWEELIDEYYTAMEGTFPLGEVPSKERLLREFQKKAIIGYFIASYFLIDLIAMDNNMPTLKSSFLERTDDESPMLFWFGACNQVGGELATEALTNILKDLIDRGFV